MNVKVKVTQSRPALWDPMDSRLLHPWNRPGQNSGVGSHSLLQGIFPTQGLNPGLPHCRWILYCLSHQGSPRILEWAACPCSRGSSRPRDQTRVSCIRADSSPAELPGKPYINHRILFSHEKEHIWVSSNEVDEPRAYYTEWSKSEREIK